MGFLLLGVVGLRVLICPLKWFKKPNTLGPNLYRMWSRAGGPASMSSRAGCIGIGRGRTGRSRFVVSRT
eukprot:4523793-Pyramimonas_sp.AAC.1